MVYISHYESPLGGITLAHDGRQLTGLWFDGQKYFGSTIAGSVFKEPEKTGSSVFTEAERWLDEYFEGKEPDFVPPLKLQGTEFQKAVWKILMTIPFGETRTYGEIAEKLAGELGLKSMSAQAVGGAVGHNPISLIVPCHRIIGASGSLTGYAGGIDKKQMLLQLEQKGIKTA